MACEFEVDKSGSISRSELTKIVNAMFSLCPTQMNEGVEDRIELIFTTLDTVSHTRYLVIL